MNKYFLFLLVVGFGCSSKEEMTLEQYKVNGEKIYLQKCANCHQTTGQGLNDLYPPIAGSDYLANKEKVICLIKNGISGPMVVNGKSFNGEMPKNKDLYNADIAQLTTYIYTKWGKEKSITEVKVVSDALKSCD